VTFAVRPKTVSGRSRVECLDQIVECLDQLVECLDRIVECLDQIVEGLDRIVECLDRIVECLDQIVECSAHVRLSGPGFGLSFEMKPFKWFPPRSRAGYATAGPSLVNNNI